MLWPVDLVSYVHPQQTNSGIQPSVSGVGGGRIQLSQLSQQSLILSETEQPVGLKPEGEDAKRKKQGA